MAKLIIFQPLPSSGKSAIINYLLTPKSELGILHLSDQYAARGTGKMEWVFLSDSWRVPSSHNNDEFLEYEEVYQDRFTEH